MPDFNKGDFTQQGVAGHVNANLRLNEKRLVNIDLTSNEEAEGCTIAGTVTDLLNDKVYPIGSAPSGNLIKCIATFINESGNIRQFGANTLVILNEDGTVGLNRPVLEISETKIVTFLLVEDCGDSFFCVVDDTNITTSNENDCLITENLLLPSDETVTECSITITLEAQ